MPKKKGETKVTTTLPVSEVAVATTPLWKRLAPLFAWLLVAGSISLTLYLVPPETLVAYIGVSNAYAMIFVLALLGGLMTFSGIPYHLILIALATTGLNPYLLGLVTGLGVICGDSFSYMLGYYGRTMLSERMQGVLGYFEHFKSSYPRLMPAAFFIFGAFLPFSNDVVTIPMGLIRYPYWKVMLPLLCGNIVFNVGLALVAVYAYEYLAVLL